MEILMIFKDIFIEFCGILFFGFLICNVWLGNSKYVIKRVFLLYLYEKNIDGLVGREIFFIMVFIYLE